MSANWEANSLSPIGHTDGDKYKKRERERERDTSRWHYIDVLIWKASSPSHQTYGRNLLLFLTWTFNGGGLSSRSRARRHRPAASGGTIVTTVLAQPFATFRWWSVIDGLYRCVIQSSRRSKTSSRPRAPSGNVVVVVASLPPTRQDW